MINNYDKKKCCGCYACVNVCPKHCITMHEDPEGFLYPVVDKDVCSNCHLCEKVCPFLKSFSAIKVPLAYVAKSKDLTVRMASSSGGIFTLLAEQTITAGGVVFGARWDDDWTVKHDFTETLGGLAVFRGSKYLQSRIGNTYTQVKAFLDAGRQVLFSGTPCQIAGLKSFLCKDYPTMLAVDFVCHGVPSPRVFQSYLKQLVWTKCPPGARIESISFRSKQNPFSWSNAGFLMQWSSTSQYGCYSEPCFQSPYGKGFVSNLYLRPSCHKCAVKGLKSGSDITVGDFWGIERISPDMDDNKGCSLALVNTFQGRKAYDEISSKLESKRVSYEVLSALQPILTLSAKEHSNRQKFFIEFAVGNESITELIVRYVRQSFKQTLKQKWRNYLAHVLSVAGVLKILKSIRRKLS